MESAISAKAFEFKAIHTALGFHVGETQIRLREGRLVRHTSVTRDRGKAHADSVLRPKDDHRASFDRLSWCQLEIIPSEKVAQNHEHLQHRVVAANAASWPAAEWQIGKGREQFFVSFDETTCVEIFRVLPVARSMVRAVNVDDDS